jgi:hypothetical protein
MIIAVASGKGETGKTTVAASLAAVWSSIPTTSFNGTSARIKMAWAEIQNHLNCSERKD